MVEDKKNPNRLKDKELISLYATKAQATALRKLSAKTKVAAQVYLRRGLDWILEHPEAIHK